MKAVVMETRGRKAAVLLKDGTFRIAHGQYRVGETIDYRDETPSLRRWLAAAARFPHPAHTSPGLSMRQRLQ